MDVTNSKLNRSSSTTEAVKVQRTHSIHHLTNGNATVNGTTNGMNGSHHVGPVANNGNINGNSINGNQQQQQQQQGHYGQNLTNGTTTIYSTIGTNRLSINKENEQQQQQHQLDNRKLDNNTKKFAFLSQPTIPDYRPQTVSHEIVALRVLDI